MNLVRRVENCFWSDATTEVILRVGPSHGKKGRKEIPGIYYSHISNGKRSPEEFMRIRPSPFSVGYLYDRARGVATETWAYFTSQGKKVKITGVGSD